VNTLLQALFLEGEPNWDNNSRKICEFGNNVLLNMDGRKLILSHLQVTLRNAAT